jgi:predicted small secreted protein
MAQRFSGDFRREIIMKVRVLLPRLIVVLLALAALVLPACNTMAGMGHDISNAGTNMECAAEKNK